MEVPSGHVVIHVTTTLLKSSRYHIGDPYLGPNGGNRRGRLQRGGISSSEENALVKPANGGLVGKNHPGASHPHHAGPPPLVLEEDPTGLNRSAPGGRYEDGRGHREQHRLGHAHRGPRRSSSSKNAKAVFGWTVSVILGTTVGAVNGIHFGIDTGAPLGVLAAVVTTVVVSLTSASLLLILRR